MSNNMNFLRGMGIGFVVGSAIGVSVAPQRKSKNAVGKALRTVGEVIENLSGTFAS